jgi:hypothetical protein
MHANFQLTNEISSFDIYYSNKALTIRSLSPNLGKVHVTRTRNLHPTHRRSPMLLLPWHWLCCIVPPMHPTLLFYSVKCQRALAVNDQLAFCISHRNIWALLIILTLYIYTCRILKIHCLQQLKRNTKNIITCHILKYYSLESIIYKTT